MRQKYIQFAFNDSFSEFLKTVPYFPKHENIIIEAGTPLIKREGIGVIKKMRAFWKGKICADIKIVDGAYEEVLMAKQAGAYSVTALGTNSFESLKIFVETCKKYNIVSVVDMINAEKPLNLLWKSGIVPDVVLIHRGRDEENSFGKIIQYKEIAKIKGKYSTLLGAAGGIDRKEMQTALFNNADLVVVNVVKPNSHLTGIVLDNNFGDDVNKYLQSFKFS